MISFFSFFFSSFPVPQIANLSETNAGSWCAAHDGPIFFFFGRIGWQLSSREEKRLRPFFSSSFSSSAGSELVAHPNVSNRVHVFRSTLCGKLRVEKIPQKTPEQRRNSTPRSRQNLAEMRVHFFHKFYYLTCSTSSK